MKTTTFYDMHSGGSLKESVALIIIEAPEAEAISVFYARYGHNPRRVTCTCCGPDYSIDEHESLEEAQNSYFALNTPSQRTIKHDEITDTERHTPVPEQGYIWQG